MEEEKEARKKQKFVRELQQVDEAVAAHAAGHRSRESTTLVSASVSETSPTAGVGHTGSKRKAGSVGGRKLSQQMRDMVSLIRGDLADVDGDTDGAEGRPSIKKKASELQSQQRKGVYSAVVPGPQGRIGGGSAGLLGDHQDTDRSILETVDDEGMGYEDFYGGIGRSAGDSNDINSNNNSNSNSNSRKYSGIGSAPIAAAATADRGHRYGANSSQRQLAGSAGHFSR